MEIDGDIHRFQRENDQIRTKQLEEKGFKIIRFCNYEVEDQLDAVLGTIAENCDLPSPNFGRKVGDEGNNENLAQT